MILRQVAGEEALLDVLQVGLSLGPALLIQPFIILLERSLSAYKALDCTRQVD